jgi:CBS domain containing-hemolysin-like protein
LKDLYYASKNDNLSIKDITRKILFFKDTEKVITVFPQLLKKSQHIAIVRDLDDQIVGMITLENVLESIV